MNCWPSGKYVHLLYVYSILGRGSFWNTKWNTKLDLIWKEGFGPLGNSPVLLLLSPCKMPLATTVAKFTRLCVVALDALTPASVHSLWSSPKFLNRFCLTILIRLWFSWFGCASFSSTLFPSTQLSVNMLGYSTLWTASFFGNECLWLYPPCDGCQWLSSGQLSYQQSSPWLCSLVNQTERPF